MNRFFGMMAYDEIKLSKSYDDGQGRRIRIDAGPNGWTVTWADGGTDYKDVEATTEENFKTAYDLMISKFPDATQIRESLIEEC